MELNNKDKKERKKGLKGFAENLWFYYKWHILIGIFVLLFLSVATVQCMRKSDPDITVLHIGLIDVGASRESIVADFGYSAADLNGNGEIDLSLAFFNVNDTTTPTRFNTELMAGEHQIYIVNDEYFEKLLVSKALTPIKDILGYELENTEGNGYGIKLKYLDIAETQGFKEFDRNLVLCLRAGDVNDKLHKNNREFFKTLLKYENDNERVTVDLVCIGKQSLHKDTVYSMEYSVYNIGREYDREHVAVMNYEEQKILTNSQGVPVFGKEEQAAALELAKDNKILIVSEEVFVYLRDNGKLASFETLGIETDGSNEKFGRKLSSLAVDDTTDLTEVPGFKYLDKELYICGTADIDGYTADMLKYMTDWTED